MDLQILAIIFFLILLLFLCSRKEKTETQEAYTHFVDWDNLNEILTVPVHPGKPSIANLQESATTGMAPKLCNPDHFNRLSVGVSVGNKPICNGKEVPFLGKDQPCGACNPSGKTVLKPGSKLYNDVVVRQPFFLEGSQTRDYYDHLYYNDFRYPERPIPVAFAQNATEYCKRNPIRYPCYVRNSRHDLK